MHRDHFPVVVHLLLIQQRRVFLLRRARTGFMDGYYALPGGYQQAGEDVSAAAIRECVEETGVRPGPVRPVCVLPYRAGGQQGLNFVFEVPEWHGEPIIAEPALFDAAGWFAADALPEPHAAWITDVLRLRESGAWYLEVHQD